MTDWREELIEKMAKAAWESDGTTCDLLLETYLTEARAALAVAEPVIREQADNALREENARLREALAPFVDAGHLKVYISSASTKEECWVSINIKNRDLRAAAAALKGDGDE